MREARVERSNCTAHGWRRVPFLVIVHHLDVPKAPKLSVWIGKFQYHERTVAYLFEQDGELGDPRTTGKRGFQAEAPGLLVCGGHMLFIAASDRGRQASPFLHHQLVGRTLAGGVPLLLLDLDLEIWSTVWDTRPNPTRERNRSEVREQ
jgi:hypothetical protein